MTFIKDYIEEKLNNYTANELADSLGISISMLTAYKRYGYNASLEVAKRVYTLEHIVLHPFSEASIKYELSKDEAKNEFDRIRTSNS